MKLHALTPMLRTWDFDSSITFYTNVLGFTCERISEPDGWASLKRDDVAIMLTRPNEHIGDRMPQLTGSLYFKVDDVESFWSALRNRVRVCYPIKTFDYGMREFGIFDDQGYLLQFGQALTEKRNDEPLEAH